MIFHTTFFYHGVFQRITNIQGNIRTNVVNNKIAYAVKREEILLVCMCTLLSLDLHCNCQEIRLSNILNINFYLSWFISKNYHLITFRSQFFKATKQFFGRARTLTKTRLRRERIIIVGQSGISRKNC